MSFLIGQVWWKESEQMIRGGGSWKPQCWVILCFCYQNVWLELTRVTDSLPPSCLDVGQNHRLGGTVGNPFADRQFQGMNECYFTESSVDPVELHAGAQKYRCRSSRRGCHSRVPAEGYRTFLELREPTHTEPALLLIYNKHFTQPTDKILVWTCPSVLKCNLSFAGQEATSRSVNSWRCWG